MKAKLRDVFGGPLAAHDCAGYVASAVWQPEVVWNKVRMEREFKVNLKKIFYGVCMCVCMLSHSVVSQSVTLWIAAHQTPLCLWNFSGINTGVGFHFLLQGIFSTQGLNPGLLHCRQILYLLSHQASQILYVKTNSHFRDFPDSSVAETLCAQCRGPRLDPWMGTRLHMPQLRPGAPK